jgi:acyl-CoA thioesterase-2
VSTPEPDVWRGLTAHLSLERVGGDAFEGWCLPGRGDRIFGGHVGAHAVVAADAASASGRAPRSVHLSFLAAGTSNEAVRYTTTLLRGGRTLEHWRVDATQGDALLTSAVVTLDRVEGSPLAHAAHAGGLLVEPESLPSIAHAPRPGTSPIIRKAFEMREATVVPDDGTGAAQRDVWLRCTEALPDDRALRAAVAVFASDLELAWTADLPHLDRIATRFGASMDHAVWLHEDWDLADWWLYRLRSPALQEGRSFLTGAIHPRGEGVVASVAQQALVRATLRDAD